MLLNKNIAISESGFVFNPMTGDSFSANPVGKDILQWMREEQSEEEIIQQLKKKYKVEPAVAEKDLYDFMLMLKTYQLIQEDEQA
ncbi:MAG: PqqD family protein [Bacteroidia bacterium]